MNFGCFPFSHSLSYSLKNYDILVIQKLVKSMENTVVQQDLEDTGIRIFKEEVAERLAELEETMLELEKKPDDPELIDNAFRALHTIKGSGGMFGFDDIVAFTHDIETVYDSVREGKLEITEELIVLTLEAHDRIGKMLSGESDSPADKQKNEEINTAFRGFLADSVSTPAPVNYSVFHDPMIREAVTYRIRFKPAPDIFASGTDLLLLLAELRELGDCYVIAQSSEIPDLEEIDPETCYISWDIILTTDKGQNAVEDVFIFIQDSGSLTIEIIESDSGLDADAPVKKLGEILVDRGDVKRKDLQTFLTQYERIGDKLTEAGLVGNAQVQSALMEQQQVRKLRESKKKSETISSIRVTSNKLDNMVDLVGELVTGQARLSQIASQKNDPALLVIAEEIERLTAELRDSTMNIRMLNFGSTFNKFKRLVRDLSHDLGVEVDLIAEGAETELDKSVIDQLNDPLVHILRNCIDHGIESSESRKAAGKTAKGTVHLSAAHSGTHVLIKIADDGAGLDPAVIRNKAIEKGLITSDAGLTESEIFTLIFEPGFSTAKAVTNVSGRGVGMDVVKKAIESLRGSVEIDSACGVGTTITIKLPLTLAIIDGLLVEVGGEFYIIPLLAVEECVELTRQNIEETHGRHMARVRDQIVPYIRLREQFNITGNEPEIEQIVITEIENNRIGFVVDNVIGQHQTVIKNLNKIYKNVETISGATIMADGTVALILDINKHLQMVESRI